MPRVLQTVEEVRGALRAFRAAGQTIGLVPTMGALHVGHASLFHQAKRECDLVVASIFVNPTQFGPREDFDRYPRPLADDLALCDAAGVDFVFHPEPAEMYPPGFQTSVEVEFLQQPLCGMSRPGHFRGVATVVLKLLSIVQPDRAYFGQKDAQQARLLLRMVDDLNVPTRLVICPIVREADGLAMSSRNRYLSAEQRAGAGVLFRTLEILRERIDAGERRSAPLLDEARRLIESTPGADVEYVEIASWRTLESVDVLNGEILIALAVRFGSTRLIDNLRLRIDDADQRG